MIFINYYSSISDQKKMLHILKITLYNRYEGKYFLEIAREAR